MGDGRKLNPNVGLLVADRWQTGIGEIGALFDVSYQRTHYSRPIGFNDYPRSGDEGPPGAEGVTSLLDEAAKLADAFASSVIGRSRT